jgi:hypothetical protein
LVVVELDELLEFVDGIALLFDVPFWIVMSEEFVELFPYLLSIRKNEANTTPRSRRTIQNAGKQQTVASIYFLVFFILSKY